MEERTRTESIWELRRRTSGHYWAKAQNAYKCAKVLFDAHASREDVALIEGFRRESSIAIELILKALIAEKSNKAPPAIHDVYVLWEIANLPALESDDLMRLTEISEILYWAGRYGAPNRDSNLMKSGDRRKKHERSKPFGKTAIISPTPFGWPEFDKLYQFVLLRFYEVHAEKRGGL